jgi:hypothetical protein
LKIYLITTEEGFTKVHFRKSTSDRAKPWRLFGPNFKWEGATRGARLAGAVLFDPTPGRALVRACAGHTKSICTRGAGRRLAAGGALVSGVVVAEAVHCVVASSS